MEYTVKQIMQAEAGMYLVNGRDATLVVMWALVECYNRHAVPNTVQKVIGLTVNDLKYSDLTNVFKDRFHEMGEYSTRVANHTHTITR